MLSKKQRIPKVFVAGVMKGGTTPLYGFLTTHPSIRSAFSHAGTPLKEIHYFSLYQHLGLDWYLSHYAELQHGQFNIDASPTYFDTCNSLGLPQLIKATSPDARIILVIRDPVERAVSHFNHLKTVSQVTEFAHVDSNTFFSRDFGAAFRELTEIDYFLHKVLSFSMYYRKFIHYREVFGDRLLVIYSEQLRTSPFLTLNHVFDFLAVERLSDPFFLQQVHQGGDSTVDLHPILKAKLRSFLMPDFVAFREIASASGHSRDL